MAATTGFRTLYPALIPPGSKHVHAVNSAGPVNNPLFILASATASSLICDFFVRSTGTSHFPSSSFENLPVPLHNQDYDEAVLSFLRLNCLTSDYAQLWEEIIGEPWSKQVPITNPLKRQIAQLRIDVAIAALFGISVDELSMIYRTQFPVMRKYDQETLFDVNGRKVPKEIVRKHSALASDMSLTPNERTWAHPQSGVSYLFEYPFRQFDREEEMKELFELYDGSRTLSGHSA